MTQHERVAIGIAWALDAEPSDDPIEFWQEQTDEYRAVLLAGAEPLSKALDNLRRH